MGEISKVVLAYSGGLDTSIIIPWLRETYHCEVIAMVADLGQKEEFAAVREKALQTGASRCYVEDLREDFARDYLFPLLKSGAVYDGKYLLGTAIARPLIACRQVQIAEREHAEAVAHGCTGKGNDQVRFELAYKALAPRLAIIAPWRRWDIHSREEAIRYAEARKIPVPASREKIYSHDENMWHRSSEGGVLEDPWKSPPEEVFGMTASPEAAPDQPAEVTLDFEKGNPVSVNGVKMRPHEIIATLNEIGGRHAIGRVDLVENRLVGMKSRGVYETPGGTLLTVAHRELESLVLPGDLLRMKAQLSLKYAELVYNGCWFTPARQSLDAFFAFTQQNVTGRVKLKLYKGNCIILGRKSAHSLYREDLATFGTDTVYRQQDAEGFINLFGLPVTVQALVRARDMNKAFPSGEKASANEG